MLFSLSLTWQYKLKLDYVVFLFLLFVWFLPPEAHFCGTVNSFDAFLQNLAKLQAPVGLGFSFIPTLEYPTANHPIQENRVKHQSEVRLMSVWLQT